MQHATSSSSASAAPALGRRGLQRMLATMLVCQCAGQLGPAGVRTSGVPCSSSRWPIPSPFFYSLRRSARSLHRAGWGVCHAVQSARLPLRRLCGQKDAAVVITTMMRESRSSGPGTAVHGECCTTHGRQSPSTRYARVFKVLRDRTHIFRHLNGPRVSVHGYYCRGYVFRARNELYGA